MNRANGKRAACWLAAAMLALLLTGCSAASLTEEGKNLVDNAIAGMGEVPFGNLSEKQEAPGETSQPDRKLTIKIVSQTLTIEGGFAYLEYPIVSGMYNEQVELQLNELMREEVQERLSGAFVQAAAEAAAEGKVLALRQYAFVTYQQGELFDILLTMTTEKDGVLLSQDVTSQIFNRVTGNPLAKKDIFSFTDEGLAAIDGFITRQLDTIPGLAGAHTFSSIARRGVLVLLPGDIQIVFSAGEIAEESFGEIRFSVYNEQTRPFALAEGFAPAAAPTAPPEVDE